VKRLVSLQGCHIRQKSRLRFRVAGAGTEWIGEYQVDGNTGECRVARELLKKFRADLKGAADPARRVYATSDILADTGRKARLCITSSSFMMRRTIEMNPDLAFHDIKQIGLASA